MTCGVYRFLFESGDVYIGSSVDIVRRCREHCRDLYRGIHSNYKLQHAWDLSRDGSIRIETIEECPEDIRLNREQFYLDQVETSKRLNLAQQVNAPVWSTESRSKLAETRRGTKHSQETREKMSQSHMGSRRPRDLSLIKPRRSRS